MGDKIPVHQISEDRISDHDRGQPVEGWLSRERALALALIIATGVIIYVCYLLVLPFLPALAWALALAVIAYPMHRWINGRMGRGNLAACISVVLVALMIVAPVIFVTQNLVHEASGYIEMIQEDLAAGKLRAAIEGNPKLKLVLPWIESQLGIGPTQPNATQGSNRPTEQKIATAKAKPDPAREPPGSGAANMLAKGVNSVLFGTAWLAAQLFTTFLALFFFFRDRRAALGVLRSLMPLSDSETDGVFSRVDETIHATVFGSLGVALVQGFMGGMMFWWLGLPAPLLWGAIMGLLAVVPVLGTFVVWAPTAAYLAFRGDWTSALILGAWGGIAIALVDNVLYPFLVGKRLRFHPLLVFIAILGGLAQFGASGVILGPLVLAVVDAILEVWRRRTAFGGTVEAGVDAGS